MGKCSGIFSCCKIEFVQCGKNPGGLCPWAVCSKESSCSFRILRLRFGITVFKFKLSFFDRRGRKKKCIRQDVEDVTTEEIPSLRGRCRRSAGFITACKECRKRGSWFFCLKLSGALRQKHWQRMVIFLHNLTRLVKVKLRPQRPHSQGALYMIACVALPRSISIA